VHRWRYSQPVVTYSEPCLLIADAAPLVLAGDAFDQPRVEGAFLSGCAAADALLNR
jgi:predicted NAD/FAD-dependent oxidoreductase